MKNKRELIIAVAFLLIGIIGTSLVFNRIENHWTQLGNDWTKLSFINNQLLIRCDTAIKEIVACVNDPKCDRSASIKRYQETNNDYKVLEKEKDNIINNIDQMSRE